MGYKSANNATSTLATGLTALATSLTVATAQGDRFPVIAGSDYTYLTLENAAGNREVVKVTARAAGADTMTIVRAQDSTVARAWNAADVVDLRLTAQIVNEAFLHVAEALAAHAASAITFTPVGGIVATDVQAALAELDTEKATLLQLAAAVAPSAAKGENNDITSLLGLTSVPGVVTTAITAAKDAAVPAGTIIDFAGATAPSGYLVCPKVANSSGSRTTHAALFAAIGTTWGAGDGTTTFGLPYFPADYAAVSSTAANVGTATSGDVKAHVHTVTDLPGPVLSGADGTIDGSAHVTAADRNYVTRDTQSTGGTDNLAAGMRVRKCVKY